MIWAFRVRRLGEGILGSFWNSGGRRSFGKRAESVWGWSGWEDVGWFYFGFRKTRYGLLHQIPSHPRKFDSDNLTQQPCYNVDSLTRQILGLYQRRLCSVPTFTARTKKSYRSQFTKLPTLLHTSNDNLSEFEIGIQQKGRRVFRKICQGSQAKTASSQRGAQKHCNTRTLVPLTTHTFSTLPAAGTIAFKYRYDNSIFCLARKY